MPLLDMGGCSREAMPECVARGAQGTCLHVLHQKLAQTYLDARASGSLIVLINEKYITVFVGVNLHLFAALVCSTFFWMIHEVEELKSSKIAWE